MRTFLSNFSKTLARIALATNSPRDAERAKKHAAEMNKGKDHYAAWETVRASE